MKKNMKQFDKCELINIDKIYNIASYSNDNISFTFIESFGYQNFLL